MTRHEALQTMLGYAFGGLGEVVHVREYDGPGIHLRAAPPVLVVTWVRCTCARTTKGKAYVKRTGKCWCLS